MLKSHMKAILLLIALIIAGSFTLNMPVQADEPVHVLVGPGGEISRTDVYTCFSLAGVDPRYDTYIVEIAEGTLKIGDMAFMNYHGMTEVILPESLESIGLFAFQNCQNLKKIIFPENLSSIGQNAFVACQSLTSVYIPKNIRRIGSSPFLACSSLTEIEVDKDHPYYFSQDGVLFERFEEEIYLMAYPIGKTESSYSIPEEVVYIELNAFGRSQNLTGIYIPASVKVIEPGAFSYCENLLSFTMDEHNSNYLVIDGIIFSRDGETLVVYPSGKAIRDYAIREGTSTIAEYAFSGAQKLWKVTIPLSVENIDMLAFLSCENLQSITFLNYEPPSMSPESFWGCNELTVRAPSSSLAEYWRIVDVFPEDSQIVSLDTPEEPFWITIGTPGQAITQEEIKNALHRAGVDIYEETYRVAIRYGVTGIEGSAFCDTPGLIDIKIPKTVTSIGDNAFTWGHSLVKIDIPASVISIGKGAFCGTETLTLIEVAPENPVYSSREGVLFNKEQTILWAYPGGKAGDYAVPEGVFEIGFLAFDACQNLTGITFPSSLEIIGDLAFYCCNSLTVLDFPASVISIGEQALDCGKLTEIRVAAANPAYSSQEGVLFDKTKETLIRYPEAINGPYIIPNSVKKIAKLAFSFCKGLTDITIPEGVIRIDNLAFGNCEGLTSITIPASVNAIGSSVFSEAYYLARIEVAPGNGSYSSLDGVLFNKERQVLLICPEAKTGAYIIPDGVTTIRDSAFFDCTHLTDITVPASVTEIGYEAFILCRNLKKITFLSLNPPRFAKEEYREKPSAFLYCSPLSVWVLPASLADYEEISEVFPLGSTIAAITFPGKPGGLSSVAGSGQVTVSWLAPADDGGIPVIKYQVQKNGDEIWTDVTSGTTYTFSGLTNGTAYAFQVRAVNVLGAGEFVSVTATPTASPLPTFSGGGTTTFTITFESNGGSAVSKQTVESGVKVTKPNDPTKEGNIFAGWFADKELTKAYNFETAVSNSFTLYAKWTESQVVVEEAWKNPFTDVKIGNWFYTDVEFVVQRGLFNGTSGITFNPQGTMTRAMLFTVLARLAKVETEGGETWYSLALAWAVKEGLTDGSNPQSPITREQIVTILWRYAGKPSGTGNLTDFSDSIAVSDWAVDAFKWAIGAGIINGKESKLVPQGLATRAEVAAILHRFIALE